MRSRTFATLLLSSTFGGVFYLASHLVADQTVAAASRVADQHVGGGASQVQPIQHPVTGPVLPAPVVPGQGQVGPVQTAPIIIRRPAPAITAPHVSPAPSNTIRPSSRLGTDARTEILERHSEQMRRDALCKRLEQRRAELRQEHAAAAPKK